MKNFGIFGRFPINYKKKIKLQYCKITNVLDTYTMKHKTHDNNDQIEIHGRSNRLRIFNERKMGRC